MRFIVMAALMALLVACGGDDEEAVGKEPSATATIGEPAACLLVEDEFRESVDIWGQDDLSTTDGARMADAAEVFRGAADRMAEGAALATHMRVLAEENDKLTAATRTGGSLDTGDFKASAAEVATICSY